tara:strand:+ start:30 stop:953 length:924 start_codon:yes stop_codon:yes gene_type:complete
MANNKLYGFHPGDKNTVELTSQLDNSNPFEFRKGMDYELTNLGCTRLAESTLEERTEATSKVLKNLQEHGGYYSALIQFEGGMNHGGKINETKFKKYLETYTSPEGRGDGMVEIDVKIENDKMVEPKEGQLKEAIKREILSILSEAKKDDEEGESEESDEDQDKKASKGAKGKEKALAALDKEIENLGKEKEKNVAKLSVPLKRYKDGKLTADEYRDLSAMMVARNKEIINRLGDIDKEKEAISLNEKLGRREVAKTMMEKDTHMAILEIIKEYGINLREGSEGIRPYYEIAKTAYQEGFMAGLHRN